MTLYEKHVQRWGHCKLCALHHSRTNVVLARGNVPCDVLFIGEAPGKSEDVLGMPMVGPAGHLLDHIIGQAMGDKTISYAITNIVACIPLGDDGEKTAEPPLTAIKACAPRLVEFVRLCRPKLIVRVGLLAKRHVTGQAQFSTQADGGLSWLPVGETLKFCDLVHPAAILRADISQRGLAIQRGIVTLQNEIEEIG